MIYGQPRWRRLLALGGAPRAFRDRAQAIERALLRADPALDALPMLGDAVLAKLRAAASTPPVLASCLARLGMPLQPSAASAEVRGEAQAGLARDSLPEPRRAVTHPNAARPVASLLGPHARAELDPTARRAGDEHAHSDARPASRLHASGPSNNNSAHPSVTPPLEAHTRVAKRLAQLSAALPQRGAGAQPAWPSPSTAPTRPMPVSAQSAAARLNERFGRTGNQAWNTPLTAPGAAAVPHALSEAPVSPRERGPVSQARAVAPVPAAPAYAPEAPPPATSNGEGFAGLLVRASANAAATDSAEPRLARRTQQNAAIPEALALHAADSGALQTAPALRERAEESLLSERLDRLLRRAARRQGIDVPEVSR